MPSNRARSDGAAYLDTSDDAHDNSQASRTYPAGQNLGGREEAIKRQCRVTNTDPAFFEVSHSDNGGSFPLAGEETHSMVIRVIPPNPPPQLGDPYTLIFRRDFDMEDFVPYTFVDCIWGHHQ